MAAVRVDGRAPRFVVDLGSPPKDRWRHVMEVYKDRMLEIEEILDGLLADAIGPKKSSFIQAVGSAGLKTIQSSVLFNSELKGISKVTGLGVGKLIAMNLVYEASACCTSVVLPSLGQQRAGSDENNEDDDDDDDGAGAGEGSVEPPASDGGFPIHARTMDWAMDFLRDVTIEVDFQLDGQTIFLATTWPGYVGVFTGMRPGAYSACVNFRLGELCVLIFLGESPVSSDSPFCSLPAGGTLLQNAKSAWGRAFPTGFLVRLCPSFSVM
jgi:beta subunit of N-acylethanolamine-hydrolyzing acid amidase